MRYVYSVLMVMLILAPLPAQADMVLDWNEYALEAIRLTPSNPPYGSRDFGHHSGGRFRFGQFHQPTVRPL